MKHPSQFIALFAALSSSLVTAETISLKGTSEGSIDKVQVETATETKVLHWSADANFDSPHETFTFPGEWTFSWDSNQPASVEFTGSFNFGTHYTITDAGSLGGGYQTGPYRLHSSCGRHGCLGSRCQHCDFQD